MRRLIILIILTFSISSVIAQKEVKPDLYLLFKPDSNNYKMQETILQGRGKAGIVYDVYCFKVSNRLDGKKMVLAYLPINMSLFTIKDSAYIKRKIDVKTISNITQIEGLKHEINAPGFPFKRLFIVEPITASKFKIVQVGSYIGSSFYP